MAVGVPSPGPVRGFSPWAGVCLPGQLCVLRSEHAPPLGGGGALAPHFGEPLLWIRQRTGCKLWELGSRPR